MDIPRKGLGLRRINGGEDVNQNHDRVGMDYGMPVMYNGVDGEGIHPILWRTRQISNNMIT
jgi:hypothetical protein